MWCSTLSALVTQGKCKSVSWRRCQEVARYGETRWASIDDSKGSNLPSGCIVKSNGELLYNLNKNNVPCTTGTQCVCETGNVFQGLSLPVKISVPFDVICISYRTRKVFPAF